MNILSITQLEKRVQNTVLFPPFDFHIGKGQTVAICCNSERAQTLIGILLGKVPPSGGEVTFLNTGAGEPTFFSQIGLVLQDEGVYERLNCKQYLNFFKKIHNNHADIEGLLEKVGLYEKRNIGTEKLTFSEKKRLLLARAILHNPSFIVLEDPAQNLDIESTLILHRLISSLEAAGKALLITTSNLENAISMTDHVYRLDDTGLKKLEFVEETEELPAEDCILEEESSEEESIAEEEISVTEEKTIEEKSIESSLQIRFDKIPAKVDDKLILFDPTEIDYIESNSGVSNLHVKGEVFPCTFTLNDLFGRLQPFGFFRCHRSYIVNLQKVREVITWTRNSYSLILDDQKKSSIPLSKGKLDELKTMIGI